MVEAFIFVVVEPNKIDKVGMEMKKIANVKDAFAVTGEYDIIAYIEAENFGELSRTVREEVLSIPGVVKTSTSVVIEKY